MPDSKRKKPKECMRIAVGVMKESISEEKKDKPSPHVGMVDTAYRGELRAGDHEY